MCVCKRIRTSRSSERFVFRDAAGPLCPSEFSKIHLCGHREKGKTVIGTVLDRVFDVRSTKVIHPMDNVYEGNYLFFHILHQSIKVSLIVVSFDRLNYFNKDGCG